MNKLDAMLQNENTNLPLTSRHTKEVLDNYVSDLKYLLEKVRGGSYMPSIHDLREYALEEYGINVGECTLRRHLRLLREGKHLWPKK